MDLTEAKKKERARVIRVPRTPQLNEEAKAEWRRLAPLLYDNGIITYLDRMGLIMICISMGEYREVIKKAKAKEASPEEAKIWAKIAKQQRAIVEEWAPEYYLHLTDEDNLEIAIA